MRQISLLATILAVLLGTSAEAQKVLVWNARVLSWDHFEEREEGSGDQVAFSYVGIEYEVEQINDLPSVHFRACFRLNESWVKRGSATTALLNHEQRLFDLAELHARKMRKRMINYIEANKSNLKMSAAINQVHLIYQEQLNAMLAEIRKYNAETMNGTNSTAQKRWDKYIDGELKKLAIYAAIKS